MYRLMQRIEVKCDEHVYNMGCNANRNFLAKSLQHFVRLAKQEGCYIEHIVTGNLGDFEDMIVLISEDKRVKRVIWIEEEIDL